MSSIYQGNSSFTSASNSSEWRGTDGYGLLWCVLFSAEGILIVIFNVLTLITFASKASLRRRSAYFILNLAAGDTLVGAFAAPLQAVTNYMAYTRHEHFHELKDISKTIDVLTGSLSMAGLLLIALDRLHATLHPLRHRRAGDLVYFYGVAFNAIIALINTSLFCIFKNSRRQLHKVFLYISIHMVVRLILIILSYTVIFVNVRFWRPRQMTIREVARRRERDLAMTLSIAAGISVLTWLPSSINLVLITLRGQRLPDGVFQATSFLRYTGALTNPIVYVFRISEFRLTLQRLCKEHFQKLGR